MVRLRSWGGQYLVDDGRGENGRMVHSVRTIGNLQAHTEDGYLVFPDAYLSFVGNHAKLLPSPTPIEKALKEIPTRGGGNADGA